MDEVALLAALRFAGTLPSALREHIRGCDEVVTGLILDGLLEVRRGGRFRSGVAALDKAEKPGSLAEPSRISELALNYALAIRHLKPAALAGRLYAFNSLPRMSSRPGDPAAEFAAQTGVRIDDPSPRIGGREWAIRSGPGWLYFRREISPAGSPGRPSKSISAPAPRIFFGFFRVLPKYWAAFAARCSRSHFRQASLVRPDKIVAYVPSFEALQETLSSMVKLSLDAAVQAVPFSAPVPGAVAELGSGSAELVHGSIVKLEVVADAAGGGVRAERTGCGGAGRSLGPLEDGAATPGYRSGQLAAGARSFFRGSGAWICD